MLNNIFEEINEAKSIVILTHQNPDIDAVASSLALKIFLGEKADVIIPTFPKTFSFLPHIDEIEKSSDKKYDLAIALDCADKRRLVGYDKYFKTASKTIIIDHHVTNERFADINYVVELSPACTQILTYIMLEKVGLICEDIATCLLAGIISDTKGLTERNITSMTFRMISYLVSNGAFYKEVYRSVMESCSVEQFRLKQLVISRVEILNNNIAVSYLTKNDILGIDIVDHKYLIKEYQNICGIDITALFIEYEKFVKVSLRSENVDVLKICKKFRGGGHINSAGFIIYDSLKNVKRKIITELM